MTRPLFVVLVVCAVAAGIYYATRKHGGADPLAASPTPPATGGSASRTPPPAAPVPRHATRLTPEQRAQVAQRIADAKARRAAGPSPQLPADERRPALPPATTPSEEQLTKSVLDAMTETIPLLKECYTQHLPVGTDVVIKADLTLFGDRDIGTLIDAHELKDDHGKPLPPAFDDCMRSTLQQLQLPPIAEGDEVRFNYAMAFGSGSDN